MVCLQKQFIRLNLLVLIACLMALIQPLSAGAGDKILWKSSGHGPASDPSQIFHDRICNAITLATGGRLTVKPFVGGTIRPAYKELDAVNTNTLQMAYTCPMYNLDKWPAAGLISARPGGLSGEALRTWFNCTGGASLMNRMMEGYDILTFPGALSPLPGEIFLHSKVRLETLKDLKGLKVRCMGDGAEILKQMGVATTVLPGDAIYQAMKKGTIDAFEYSTPASNWSMRFNEVAPYVYLSSSRAPSDPQVFFINKTAWAQLPEDLQAIVKACISQHTQAQHEFLVYASLKALDKFRKAGNTVLKVPRSIEEALLAEAEKFYEEKSRTEDAVFVEIYQSMKTFGRAYASMYQP